MNSELPEENGSLFPSTKPFDKQFKVIIIGDACCGKTTLLHRIVDGKQPDSTKYDLTIGVDTRSKTFPFTIMEKGKAPKDVKIKL